MEQPSVSQKSPLLSTRELEVLKLLVEGYNNVEIAASLHVSRNTIKSHIRSILDKFGVDSRIQAAVFAVRTGLV